MLKRLMKSPNAKHSIVLLNALIFLIAVFGMISMNTGCTDSYADAGRKMRKTQDSLEYLNLFTAKAKNDIFLSYLEATLNNHSYAELIYMHRYIVVVHKLDLVKDASLENLILLNKGVVESTPWTAYQGKAMNKTILAYIKDNDSLLQQLCVTYSDSIEKYYTSGDTLIGYRLKSHGIALGYKNLKQNDFVIHGNVGGGYANCPLLELNLVVLKKGMAVYLIIMYSDDKHDNLSGINLVEMLGK